MNDLDNLKEDPLLPLYSDATSTASETSNTEDLASMLSYPSNSAIASPEINNTSTTDNR